MNNIPNLIQRYKRYRRGRRLNEIQVQFEKFWSTFPLRFKNGESARESIASDIMYAFYSGAQFDVNDECYADYFRHRLERALRIEMRDMLHLKIGAAPKEQFEGIRSGLLGWADLYYKPLSGISSEFDEIMEKFQRDVKKAKFDSDRSR